MSEQSSFQPPNNENEYQSEAQKALGKERQLPLTGWQQEVDRGLEYGLEAAPSINDRPVSLQFAFEVQTRNAFLEGVELVIRDIPLIAFCQSCQQEYKPKIGLQYSCPDCKSPMEDIRSGRELKIDRIEYSSINTCKGEQPFAPTTN